MKKVSGLILLFIMLICSITLSITYSKYILSKNISGTIHVPEVDYCLRKGITKLNECMLVMENYSNDVDSAKLYVSGKKDPDFTNTAPITNNIEYTKEETNGNGLYSSTYNFTVGPSYTFDESTGVFSLVDFKMDVLDEKYKDYYTCGAASVTLNTCFTLYQIKEISKDVQTTGTNYMITSAIIHDFKPVDSFDSEIGLYSAPDDYGTSYYYRGNVKNNYVSYAGYIWRIIRQNGDGTIRLIYAGTDTTSQSVDTTIGNSRYDTNYADHTYVGYMYGKDFVKKTESTIVSFKDFSPNIKYYFGSSYSFDKTTKLFSITGDYLYGTWSSDYTNIINNYPYTCRETSASATCLFALNITGYHNLSSMYAKYLSYSSKDYQSTLTNTYNSTIKTMIDTWYKNNLLPKKDEAGIPYINYLSDATFCNDRTYYNGDGFNAYSSTSWNGKKRTTSYTPSLKCSQLADKFSTTSSFGNGALNYPVGLITSDELIMSGAKYDAANLNFYLYNGLLNATMTPFDYANWRGYPRILTLGTMGEITYNFPRTYRYIRPVINLKSDIEITEGDGSINNPYIVTLR